MTISLVGTPTESSASNPASGTFTLPSGYAAGDLIVGYFFSRAEAFNASFSDLTTKVNYTGSAGYGQFMVGYKWCASGTETDPTFTRGSSTSNCTTLWGCFILRGVVNAAFSGASGDPFYQASAADPTTGTAQNVDPPALSGSADAGNMVLTMFGRPDDIAGSCTQPTNYTLNAAMWADSTTGTDGAVGVSYRTLTAAGTENPGAWTLGSGGLTNNSLAYTWAFRNGSVKTGYGKESG